MDSFPQEASLSLSRFLATTRDGDRHLHKGAIGQQNWFEQPYVIPFDNALCCLLSNFHKVLPSTAHPHGTNHH
jgi:hypothetical protein